MTDKNVTCFLKRRIKELSIALKMYKKALIKQEKVNMIYNRHIKEHRKLIKKGKK